MPFNKTSFPELSLTAIPSLSQSGSVPITISAFTLLARSIAISKASGSSGFGDFTVGKSPFGNDCSSTICTFLKPANFNDSGTAVIDVP